VTTNGVTDAVLLSPEAYDDLAESLAMIERGIGDVRSGRTQPVREALKKIAEELGLSPIDDPVAG
jgi:hypothetical protein